MWQQIKTIKSGRRELRNFGWTIGIALIVIGAVLLWQDKPRAIWLVYMGAAAIVFGSIVPYILWPLHKVWMTFSIVLGRIMTPVILTVVYFTAFTLTRFAARLFGKRFLELRIDKSATSYWRVRTEKPSAESYSKEF